MKIRFQTKERPRITQFRCWIAMKLVRLGHRIYPDSPDVVAFYSQLIVDQLIHGQCITRVSPEDFMKEQKQ